ncbi:MAG: hypothetical protein HYZ47_00165 [Simkania negevensis]|nr:hypothetical protein [Simkania negevensis]
MKTGNKAIVGTLAIFSLLAGCASYNATALNDLVEMPIPAKDGVSITAKAFSEADCKKYLDRNVIAEGYQPVLLQIMNHSNKTLLFSPQKMDLPTETPEVVASKVHTSTAGRVIGYTLASILIPPLLIAAIVDGIKSSHANQALDHDFAHKGVQDKIISPHSVAKMVLFVPKHMFKRSFQVHLVDKETDDTKHFTAVVL